MKSGNLKRKVAGIAAAIAISLAIPQLAAAHCDTMDGPVIKDARVALEKGEVTPVLKWVRKRDEAQIQKVFKQAMAASKKGAKAKEAGEHRFFESLVKIHRASEGAPFSGLKPAGAVEPAVAEADKALAGGSADALVQLISDDVAAGIRERFDHAAETYRHKDESVAQGREFVKAYVEFTHYVERLHADATGKGHSESHEGSHSEHKEGARHSPTDHGAEKH
jgi:hypothetical protein